MPITPYGKYHLAFNGEVVTDVQDFFEIKAAPNAVVTIEELFWNQYGTGTTDEFLKMTYRVYSGTPSSGSGGSSITPQKLARGDAAAGSTAERNNTTQISGGVVEYEKPFVINSLRRERKELILIQEPIILSPGEFFVWALATNPTDGLSLDCHIVFNEYGG